MEASKFGPTLDALARAKQGVPEPELVKSEPVAPPPSADDVRRGRPAVGKRSNPEYGPTTVFLRLDTMASARRRLFSTEEDFSELVERLVQDWLKDGGE